MGNETDRNGKEGVVTEEKESKEADANSCKCPFCPCCFLTRHDLERHMAAFGNNREEHSEDYRRTHDRVEYGSASVQSRKDRKRKNKILNAAEYTFSRLSCLNQSLGIERK